MAVQSKQLHTARHSASQRGSRARPFLVFCYSITLLLASLAAYALISVAVERVRVLADDIHYGRPRTTHIDGFVGHSESDGTPTHITAINIDRRIVVIELPGGDPAQARTIIGPYLVGAEEHLTPIELGLRDVDGDTMLDLLVTIRREQIVYLNKDGVFRLPNAEEHATISRGTP